MKRIAAVLLLLLPAGVLAQVETKGVRETVRMERPVSGHLTELNGRFKLRATELVIEPGGFIGAHHHVGPGIRYVVSGELTFVQGQTTTVHRAGDYVYEAGNVTHTARNRSQGPLRVIAFEIVPADSTGSSAIPPRAIQYPKEKAKK